MIREAVATGDSVEVAFAKACRELGIDTIDAECEILEMPQKKTLGLFGGRPAKVRAYIEIPDPVKPEFSAPDPVTREPAAKEPTAPAAPAHIVEAEISVKPVEAVKSNSRSDGPAQDAAVYLKSVLSCMGLTDADVSVELNETGAALTLSGGDIGFVIGHRGETLDALQYLASLVANHTEGSYFRLTLDVGNYREKRKETLEALGRKMAYRAIKTGRNSSLEPMNPYERRIIHTAVQAVDGAKSWSEGEDQGRHVVIGPEGGERFQSRGRGRGGYNSGGSRGFNRDDRRGERRDNRRGDRQRSSQPSAAPRAGGPKSDDPAAPIYGKIEVKK